MQSLKFILRVALKETCPILHILLLTLMILELHFQTLMCHFYLKKKSCFLVSVKIKIKRQPWLFLIISLLFLPPP